ncbi:hypothetical protein DVA67_025480 [Solirubrobacter sp. CPCC 204708]|uniref:PLD phosphodiesterase domain-containing protein n=1 Tax=Solirubrobacter deserti TaxID=2282478 RepID=A0ABT4RQR1_9ACTN|nr:hypothetical protein [Solirubrobacter deserti]MBE2319353.1 hypothetical protein [Solirubrobacter deserti]MDA0140851.1 hypothetical protein [Solirubrobacter deserti]
MTALPPVITPNDAQQRLTDDGLLALGLTVPLLGPSWSNADATFDNAALTLTMTPGGGARPPFLGIRTWVADLRRAGVYDVSGLPLTGIGAVLRLHPQAATRLDQLVATRLGAAGPIRPVPHTMVVRCATNPALTARWFAPGESIDIDPADTPVMSFHDARGLIVDPVAVAALFNDLATAFPALAPLGVLNTPGGVTSIAGKATGIVVQVVDPHGAPFRAVDSLAPRKFVSGTDSGDAVGLVALNAADGIGIPASGDGAARIRVGWTHNGVLDRTTLTVPAGVPAGIARQFLRVTAVDLKWHLLGNRSNTVVYGIDGADQAIPEEFRPAVRDRVRLDFLVDGVDVLSASGSVLGAIGAGWQGLAFASSPVIDDGVGLPGGHWPAFPVALGGGAPPSGQPDTGLVASWSGDQDVLLTFPGGTIPLDWHVRVYPQVFKRIESIGPAPSFLRGDGAAHVVADNNAFSLLLTNPLDLPVGAVQPPGRRLIFDLVVTDRMNATRTFGNVIVPIGAPSGATPVDAFGTPDPMAGNGAVLKAVAAAPVFGIPAPEVDPALPTSILEMLRRLGGESDPREGPRLPTQARFASLLTVGTGDTAAPMTWDAVVSGGRWARETRSAMHALGNPGNPAGPDVHAAGVRVDGAAAFDVAQIAARRAQPLLPFLASAGVGWLPVVANTGWAAPAEPANDTAPAGQTAPRSCAAAVLRTIAVKCESPELALIDDIPAADASINDLIDVIVQKFGFDPDDVDDVDLTNEAQIVREIRREFHTQRFGSRDAQWALRRAVRQARDLVFISSPAFSATKHEKDPPGPAAPHELDLVAELALRMNEQQSLLVLVCVPRWPDADPLYGGWVRQAFKARNAALQVLKDVDPARVVAFHPNGFPGRAVAIRSTTVVVDDAWALVGTSHWRRRGMTFDDGVDIVGFDRTTDGGGASARIRTFRQALLASLTGVTAPVAPATDADWSRLGGTRSCVDLVGDLVAQGGLGRLAPFWEGPTDTDVAVQSDHVADPDGGTSDEYLLRFATLIGENPGGN